MHRSQRVFVVTQSPIDSSALQRAGGTNFSFAKARRSSLKESVGEKGHDDASTD
jgi:hypothetical protein